ncbi:MAG: hypothetical protein ABSE39_10580 [Candidatus Bathyarchaeia archaeon]|jgi:hypothetical protein
MVSCTYCLTMVSERALFCHRCGARLPASNQASAYNVPADLLQQVLGLLSRLWVVLSQEERGTLLNLLPYANQGHPTAIQNLRQWTADRSRYDPRPNT